MTFSQLLDEYFLIKELASETQKSFTKITAQFIRYCDLHGNTGILPAEVTPTLVLNWRIYFLHEKKITKQLEHLRPSPSSSFYVGY